MESTAADSGKGVRSPPPFTSIVDLEAAIDIIRVIGILVRAPKLPTRPIRVPRAGRTWRGVVGGVAEGSGALLTRNIGKINYLAALDVSLAQHKLLSIPRVYLFEQFSEEMGCVTMFEWADPIQSYSGSKWTYDSQLTPSVDGGMIDDIHNIRR
jgi:hypothetical protein